MKTRIGLSLCVTVILALLLNLFVCASEAVNEIASEELDEIISRYTFKIVRQNKNTGVFDYYDINDNGEILLGNTGIFYDSVKVYSDLGVYQYAIEFSSLRDFYTWWEGNIIAIHLRGTPYIVYYNSEIDVLSVYKDETTSFLTDTFIDGRNNSKRTINDMTYVSANRFGILGLFMLKKSILVSYDANNEMNVLYDATKAQQNRIIGIAISFMLFFSYIAAQLVVYIIALRKSNKIIKEKTHFYDFFK